MLVSSSKVLSYHFQQIKTKKHTKTFNQAAIFYFQKHVCVIEWFDSSVVDWLERCDCDWHGLDAKPTCPF